MNETADRTGVPREIHTPSSLTRFVRDLLEDALPLIWVEGELSNVARPASGHLYFTLKDNGAQVRCAMFKPKSSWLRFKPIDGMRVMARARVSLYEARGEFQLIVESLEDAGEGALQRAFEALKSKLAAEGLFDAGRKRAIPQWPRRIGVITSPSGAAVRDVLSVIARRFALADVEILPIPVQGKDAPAAIIAMVNAAQRAQRHDVLLLTRGGGSLEDLAAFNDEALARALHACTIPLVSAIGHEIDFTIADFVADLRAPTPSAAAELLVPDTLALTRLLDRDQARLAQRIRRSLETRAQRIDHLRKRLDAQRPQTRLRLSHEKLTELRARLVRHSRQQRLRFRGDLASLDARLRATGPLPRIARERQRVHDTCARLFHSTTSLLQRRRVHLTDLARTLHAVSPLATLERGYAILRDRESGRVIRRVGDTATGHAVTARLVDGELDLHVDSA